MAAPATSRAYLPPGPNRPATILEHFIERFPRIERATWIDRMARGTVRMEDGTPVTPGTLYQAGRMVLYEREVAVEPDVPHAETIVYRDERILIADKPHFLPVTPTGPYVRQSLLWRLQERTGIRDMTPMHRLDLATAGLVLFALRPEFRAAYHALFANHEVTKEYLAVAIAPEPMSETSWLIEDRLEPGEPWFRQRVVGGTPNASTAIELIDWRQGLALFRLLPRTGRKHQLRVHLASLGWPILNDDLYGGSRLHEPHGDDDRPLQLLAYRLSFSDPITSAPITATTHRILAASAVFGFGSGDNAAAAGERATDRR